MAGGAVAGVRSDMPGSAWVGRRSGDCVVSSLCWAALTDVGPTRAPRAFAVGLRFVFPGQLAVPHVILTTVLSALWFWAGGFAGRPSVLHQSSAVLFKIRQDLQITRVASRLHGWPLGEFPHLLTVFTLETPLVGLLLRLAGDATGGATT